MKLFTKAFIGLFLLTSLCSCNNDNEDVLARKDPSRSTADPQQTSSTRNYSGLMNVTNQNWEDHECPALGPNGNPQNALLTINFTNSNFSILIPENPSIPGFNNAFSSTESTFSFFGRGFTSEMTSDDEFGDFNPSIAACTYANTAVLKVNGILSPDFNNLQSTTYTLTAGCSGENEAPVELCAGEINGTLQL